MLAFTLVLMTYNLNYANPSPDVTIAAIAHADPDVVLLQEVTPAWRDALTKALAARYPHRAFHTGRAGGIAVLSKLPIADEQLLPAPTPDAWFPAQRVVLTTASGPLQILNVHLRPAYDGGWVRGYLTTPPLREAEIKALWAKLPATVPTLVAGDFNEEPSGLAVGFLAKQGLARVPTTGPRTWQSDREGTRWLQLDIDHVMIDGRLRATDGKVLDAGTSDHRPVVVTLGA